MTQEQIKNLTREYIEEIYREETSEPFIEKIMYEESINVESVIRFLLHRYCLVEKDTIRETLWKLTDKFLEDKDYKAFGAASTAIESLFPEIAKEVEG